MNFCIILLKLTHDDYCEYICVNYFSAICSFVQIIARTTIKRNCAKLFYIRDYYSAGK